MTIIFKFYEYLNINDIEIMLITLCPIYRTPGRKAMKSVKNNGRQDSGVYTCWVWS